MVTTSKQSVPMKIANIYLHYESHIGDTLPIVKFCIFMCFSVHCLYILSGLFLGIGQQVWIKMEKLPRVNHAKCQLC